MREEGGKGREKRKGISVRRVHNIYIFFYPKMTGAFSRNIDKLFSELKLVTDNLLLHLYIIYG